MVDATERHQVRRESAVGNTPLHKSDLNAGIWIVQKPEVFFRTIGLAQFHRNLGSCYYALIAGTQNVVMLVFRRGRDCDLRRQRGDEIFHSKPGETCDTQHRGQYFENVPTSDPQHERSERKLYPHSRTSNYTCCLKRGNGTCRMSGSGTNRTYLGKLVRSAFDPQQTWAALKSRGAGGTSVS